MLKEPADRHYSELELAMVAAALLGVWSLEQIDARAPIALATREHAAF